MAIKSSKPPRTLSDIKTNAGRGSRDKRCYANFFRMGALELERWRREQEREAASRRTAEIDRRIGEIDSEMETLLDDVDLKGRWEVRRDPQRQANGHGLRIKY